MKLTVRFLAIAACLFTAVTAADAKKFSYPSVDKEWFSVDIPADWNPEVDDEESLEATSPDEEAYLAFWVLKGAKEIKGLEFTNVEGANQFVRRAYRAGWEKFA